MAYDAGFASELASQAAQQAAGYVTLGTRDMPRSRRFYDLIAREMGARRAIETDHLVAWGLPGFGLAVSEMAPALERGRAPLQAEDREQVDRLFEIALRHGGSVEHAPCDHGAFYAAYFRDPDGNRLNAFCMTQH